MCCRYSLQKLAEIAAFYEQLAEGLKDDWSPQYNAAPSHRMPVVVRRNGRNELDALHFGFLSAPRVAGKKPALLPNARAETLLDRPAFREATQHRRCLVPADGFYEWEKHGAQRLPHYFRLTDRRTFFFAGLWQPSRDGAPPAFCIVTTEANAVLSPIHDRMPVMLGPNSGPAWLGDEPLPPTRLTQICRPLRADLMTGHRVNPRMNNACYEAPDCILPL